MNTKTDRELIELAAKAVGGVLSEGHTKKRTGKTWDEWEWIGPIGIRLKNGITMHPLINDGDAFRLMAALELTPHFYSDRGTTLIVVDDVKDPEGYDVLVKWNGDEAAATRRAIVMAAAKIGEHK